MFESLSEDDLSRPGAAGSLVHVVFAHNKHRYIPLLSSGGLIRKAQAIPQDLPQDLTNLLSYAFVTSRNKQLIAFFPRLRLSFKPTRSFFSLESELTLRHLSLFSIAGQSVCISG